MLPRVKNIIPSLSKVCVKPNIRQVPRVTNKNFFVEKRQPFFLSKNVLENSVQERRNFSTSFDKNRCNKNIPCGEKCLCELDYELLKEKLVQEKLKQEKLNQQKSYERFKAGVVVAMIPFVAYLFN